MKFCLAILGLVLLMTQYRLWVSGEGVREVWQLREAVATQRAENDGLVARNAQLKAEVRDLKEGLTALEERARHDLGMVGRTETFYQVIETTDPAPPPAAAQLTQTALPSNGPALSR